MHPRASSDTCLLDGARVLTLFAGLALAIDTTCDTPQACYEQAQAVDNPRDLGYAEAVEMFWKACEQGHQGACGELGRERPFMYPKQAIEKGLLPACNGGQAAACTLVGRMLSRPDTELFTPDMATSALERACTLGNLDGCLVQADLAMKGTLGSPDPTKAVDIYIRNCDLGHGPSCKAAGDATTQGLGATRSWADAAELYDLGCRAEDPYACFALAELVRRGRGVDRSRSRAASLYDQACKGEVPTACEKAAKYEKRR